MIFTNRFIHHVFFWLKNAESQEDLEILKQGLQKLSTIKTIRHYQIGIPASTRRPVIDSSYAISWLLVFDNATDQESYQQDPIHLHFISTYSHLWNCVVVYDSVEF